MALSVDLHEHLIKVSFPMAKAAHPVHPPTPTVRRDHRAEAVPPKPNRLVIWIYAAFEKHILDVRSDCRVPRARLLRM